MASSAAPSQAAGAQHGCATRAKRLTKPVLSYIGQFVRSMQEGLWDPKKNPDGWIPLVVAENKLNNAAVLSRLAEVKDYPPEVLNYSGMKGIPELQQAMAGVLERYVAPGHAFDPNDLCISAGCSAIVDNMFYCLCDEGDGVLIPAPLYPAFIADLQNKCCVHPLPFYLSESAAAEGLSKTITSIRAQLDAAVADAASFGVPVKAILSTNPHNPLGTIYSDETILEMMRWCLDNRVHYVSDEIYALSVFKKEARFTSAITLAQQLVAPPAPAPAAAAGAAGAAAANGAEPAVNGGAAAGPDGAAEGQEQAGQEQAADGRQQQDGQPLPGQQLYSQQLVDDYVHLLYGLSKDWCASGLRVGLLYSRNARLQLALNGVASFAGCSNHTQWGMAQVLSDHEWCAAFIEQNQRTLERSYDALAAALKAEGIPFTPAVAGMFVWVDLRRWLKEPTWEAEREFWQLVCDKCRVILTPGKDCHAAEPGFFRLCFAWMRPEALPEAICRMKLLAAPGAEGQASDCSLQ